MQTVDLTLAVNYLPACGCLIRLIVLILALSLVPTGEEILGGYLVIAAALYLDRSLTFKVIFDGNAILMAVFLANVHAVIRATSSMRAYAPITGVAHLIWGAACTLLIADPPILQQAMDKRGAANKLAPVSAMLVNIVLSAYFHCELEPISIRACRAVSFTLLAFAWIYVIGIHSSQGVGYLKENNWQFITRLAPMLYSPMWVSILFCPAIIWALTTHHSSRQKQPSCSPNTYAPLLPVSLDDPVLKEPSEPPPAAEPGPAPPPQDDLEAQHMQELLRQAKQALTGTTRARHQESFRPEG